MMDTDGTDGTGIRVRKRTDCSEMNRLFDNGQYFLWRCHGINEIRFWHDNLLLGGKA